MMVHERGEKMVIVPSAMPVRTPFSSNHTLAKVLVVLFLVAATIDAIAAYSDLMQADLISSMLIEFEQLSFEPAATDKHGSFRDAAYDKQAFQTTDTVAVTEAAVDYEDGARINDDRQAFIGLLQLVWLPVFVLFLIWFYKVHSNLLALGIKELNSSARMAVAYFFIPIICLYKPYTIAAEIWKGSTPGVDSTTISFRRAMNSPGLLKLWWIFWIVSGIVSFYLLRFEGTITDESSMEAFIHLSWILLVADMISAGAAILTALVVGQIDKMQRQKSEWILPSPVQ